jgi:hypothetical protein
MAWEAAPQAKGASRRRRVKKRLRWSHRCGPSGAALRELLTTIDGTWTDAAPRDWGTSPSGCGSSPGCSRSCTPSRRCSSPPSPVGVAHTRESPGRSNRSRGLKQLAGARFQFRWRDRQVLPCLIPLSPSPRDPRFRVPLAQGLRLRPVTSQPACFDRNLRKLPPPSVLFGGDDVWSRGRRTIAGFSPAPPPLYTAAVENSRAIAVPPSAGGAGSATPRRA